MCLTTYEGVQKNIKDLKLIQFKYLVIDEAHKMKNELSQLSTNIRGIRAKRKTLLTGTPLANDVKEIWSLLYFIMPNLFKSTQLVDEWLQVNINIYFFLIMNYCEHNVNIL